MKKLACKLLASVCTAAVALGVCGAQCVKVSEFGFNRDDSTEFIRKALSSGAKKVVFDRQESAWRTDALTLGSDIEIVLEEGVELVAKKGGFVDTWASLFDLIDSKNVTIRGEGRGATLRMLREDYIKEPYLPSEHRHGINMLSAENIRIENLRIVATGGDGIYLGESCSKGICKEGERGENGPCRDIVIRKCDCDINHRQGISVISAENMLIEDTVLRNTLGTAPRAGIDFEPNFDGNRLVNCVMRNCLVENNRGAGFEFYLANQGIESEPISVIIENCRSVGNSEAVSISDGGREKPHAKGYIRFSGCSFENPRGTGISVNGKPESAYVIAFAGCTVSNAARKAVYFGTRKPSQGPVGNVDLGDLRIFGGAADGWFSTGGIGFGPSPKTVRGTVTQVAADGAVSTIRIDNAWAERNMPAFRGGKIPPPRGKLPEVAAVTVEDACPGELADLAPVYGDRGPQYVLFADRRKVRFVARRIFGKFVADPPVKPFAVRRLDKTGFVGEPIELVLPGAESKEYAFPVSERGFYALEFPRMRGKMLIEKSSVPIAIAATGSQNCLKTIDGKPFELSFHSDGSAFEILSIGNSYDDWLMRVVDPLGKTVFARETGHGTIVAAQESGSAAGFWKMSFDKASKPHFATIFIDVFGTDGFLFLSPAKRWR